jgi:oligosaccharyltransferase complex subunit beta
MKPLFFLVLFLFLYFVYEKNILVILDNEEIKNSHSQFFQQLSKRHTLQFQTTKAFRAHPLQFGEYIFDDMIIMAPKTDNIPEFPWRVLLDFVDTKHNVILVSGSSLSFPQRELASQNGVKFDDDDSKVFDYFNTYNNTENGITKTSECHPKVAKCSKKNPILFRGLAMSLEDNNELLFPILTGSKTSFSYSSEAIKDIPHVMGKKTVLVGGLQARNSARITFIGSLDMLSNEFYNQNGTGNKEFVENLLNWSLGEKGILRHRKVFHNKVGFPDVQPGLYTICEDMEYHVTIEEFVKDLWVPYEANDIQLELVMLDPYIRLKLNHTGGGRYYCQMKVPDTYGVFKFKMDYKREGYSHLIYEDEIVIRPLRINQFERFIEGAYPYYATVLTAMVAFFIFGFAFIYTRDKEKSE